MKRASWIIVLFACGPADQSIDPDIIADASPGALLVGERTRVTLDVLYEANFDRGDTLSPVEIDVESDDVATLRAVDGLTDGLHRWSIDEPSANQSREVEFECLQVGLAGITVRTQLGDVATFPIQCSDEPRSLITTDPIEDWIDSISTDLVERRDAHTDLRRVAASIIESAEALIRTVDCEAANVVCTGDLGTGPVLHAAAILDAPPRASPDHLLVYALVVRADDDPTNDWVPRAPFDWDLFQGTDSWLQLIHEPGRGWRLEGTRVDSDQNTQPLVPNAIATRQSSRVDFYVPLADLVEPFEFRMTTFAARDSTYPADDRGGDVPGANPTEPLLILE